MTYNRNVIRQEPNGPFLFAIDLLRNTLAQKSGSKCNSKRRKQSYKDNAERRGEKINPREQRTFGAW